ncbi:MAG: amidinotransferase [Deltaproteobacteria bacterium]|nr:amidinotransferase [Deltaproteobacteria bacterium]
MQLIRTVAELPDIEALPRIPRPNRILLVEPEFYDVEYVINPHMAAYVEGVDRLLARQQWLSLRRAYETLSDPVEVLPGEPFLPDFVFTANQALPVPPGLLAEGPSAVLSIMKSSRRQPEIRPYAAALEERGLHLERLDPYVVRAFEGTGDGSWHPERALLLGGVGPRSTTAAYERISAWTGVPVVLLELTDPRFYHLDTCLSPIDSQCALYYPGAFTDEGVALIEAVYPEAIAVQEAEAVNMVCNGHCPDGQHFLVHPGCPSTFAALEARGLEIVLLDTSEYLKSGGSVFCMKLHYWS